MVVIFSGYITYLFRSETNWQQWTYLTHLLAGVLLSFTLSIYIFYHFRRSIGRRLPGISALGILTTLAFIVVAATSIPVRLKREAE